MSPNDWVIDNECASDIYFENLYLGPQSLQISQLSVFMGQETHKYGPINMKYGTA